MGVCLHCLHLLNCSLPINQWQAPLQMVSMETCFLCGLLDAQSWPTEGPFLIAVLCLLPFSHPLQSPHCSILQPSPVLSLLKSLPRFLESPFLHHSHNANSQSFKKTWVHKCLWEPVISRVLYCLHPSIAQDTTPIRGTSCP